MGDPGEFRGWLLQRMVEVGLERPADLARATGINASLIGRWIRGDALPGMPNLAKLSPVLNVSIPELAARAGHMGDQLTPATRPGGRSPVVQELERMLADSSPLPVDQREALERLVVALITPYRSYFRQRRAV